jgi:hypothetical protein
MKKYTDPPNIDELVTCFNNLPQDSAEIQKFIETTFPGWIVLSTTHYSPDYPHLQRNWEAICKMNGVTSQKIVIVDYINFNKDEYKLINLMCERMTTSGYAVRRKEEFIYCNKCYGALPIKQIWKDFKDKGIPVCSVWSPNCSKCI